MPLRRRAHPLLRRRLYPEVYAPPPDLHTSIRSAAFRNCQRKALISRGSSISDYLAPTNYEHTKHTQYVYVFSLAHC